MQADTSGGTDKNVPFNWSTSTDPAYSMPKAIASQQTHQQNE